MGADCESKTSAAYSTESNASKNGRAQAQARRRLRVMDQACHEDCRRASQASWCRLLVETVSATKMALGRQSCKNGGKQMGQTHNFVAELHMASRERITEHQATEGSAWKPFALGGRPSQICLPQWPGRLDGRCDRRSFVAKPNGRLCRFYMEIDSL